MSKKDGGLKARCVSCGFAAKRTEHATPAYLSLTYFEISKLEREGKIQFVSIERSGPYNKQEIKMQLACFVRVADLHGEAITIQKQTQRPYYDCAQDVLSEERSCERCYEHTEGLSPKEHLEMFNAERVFEITQRMQEDSLKAARRNLGVSNLLCKRPG